MILDSLWGEGNAVAIVAGDKDLVSVRSVFPGSGTVAVARLDGSVMPDEGSVFDAFYWSLCFPEYFGWNWDALSDCLRDLGWIPADRYVLLIDHAEMLLRDEPEGRKLLFSILRRAADQWADPRTSRRHKAIPFKVIFVCAEADMDRLREEVEIARQA